MNPSIPWKKILLVTTMLLFITSIAEAQETVEITATQEPWYIEGGGIIMCNPTICNGNDGYGDWGSWSCNGNCRRRRSRTYYDYCCPAGGGACTVCDTSTDYDYDNCGYGLVCVSGTCRGVGYTCGYGSWSCLDSCNRRRDFLRCDGSNNCDVDVGNDNEACSGCEGGVCTGGACSYGSWECNGDCERKRTTVYCLGSYPATCNSGGSLQYEDCSQGSVCSGGSCSPGACGSSGPYCEGSCGYSTDTYSCDGSGNCDYVTGQLSTDCSWDESCSGGSCDTPDCGTDQYVYGSWSCTDSCTRRRTKTWRDYGCSSGSCTYSDGSPTYEYDYCDAGEYCSGSTCVSGECDTCRDCDGSGNCNAVTAGTDPNNDCTAINCQTGNCDGSGSCQVYSGGQKGTCSDCYYCNDGDTACDLVPSGQDPNSDCPATAQNCNPGGEGTNCGWKQLPGTCDGSGSCNDIACNDCGPHEADTTGCYDTLLYCNETCGDGFECDENGDCADICNATTLIRNIPCGSDCICDESGVLVERCNSETKNQCVEQICGGQTYTCHVTNGGKYEWATDLEYEQNCVDYLDNDCNGLTDEEDDRCTPPIWQNQQQNDSRIPKGGGVLLQAQGWDNLGLYEAWLWTNETCYNQSECNGKNYTDAVGCTGSPAECDSYSIENNCTNAGCDWSNGSCSGTCNNCTSYDNSSSCTGQIGCQWGIVEGGPEGCGGTCTDCTTYGTESPCNSQDGCSWGGGCSGSCTTCSSIGDSTNCSGQGGCSWDPANCEGTAAQCDEMRNAEECEQQDGCSWEEGGGGSCSSSDIDQEQDRSNNGIDLSLGGVLWAQTFRAGETGDLDYLEIEMACSGALCTSDVTVGITTTRLGEPDTALTNETISPTTGGLPAFIPVNFSDPASLTSGDTYAIVIAGGTSDAQVWRYDSSSPYVNGNALRYSGGRWGPASGDFAFRTYMNCPLSFSICNGTATACGTYGDSTNCNNQAGCSWDTANCEGSCTSCGSYGSEGTCEDQLGCSWTSTGCSGTCTVCDTYGTEIPCDSQDGCTWGTENSCYGNCSNCTSLNSTSCGDQGGCSWEEGEACDGTCTSCDTYGTEGTCDGQGGCSWDPAACGGSCSACSSFVQETNCDNQGGCSWDTANCEGTATACGTYGSSIPCNAQDGCSWTTSSECGGTGTCMGFSEVQCELYDDCMWSELIEPPIPGAKGYTTRTMNNTIYLSGLSSPIERIYLAGSCIGILNDCDLLLDEETCELHSCDWSGSASCLGTATSCGSYGSSSPCNSQDGCSWDTANCEGSCTSCGTYGSEGACTAQEGCSWGAGSCTGSCSSCGTYGSSETCATQDGCSWDTYGDGCTGNPDACGTYDEETCSDYSCTWLSGYYGSPFDLGNVSQTWTWANFEWSNASVPVGTNVSWKVYFWDTDNNVNGSMPAMHFQIIDTQPPIGRLTSIRPGYPNDKDRLTCSWIPVDEDSSNVYANVTWYKKTGDTTEVWNTFNAIPCTNATLCSTTIATSPGPAATSVGEVWNCSVLLYDDSGKNSTSSANVTIVDDILVVFTDGSFENYSFSDIDFGLWTESGTNTMASFDSTCAATDTYGEPRGIKYASLPLENTDKIIDRIHIVDTEDQDYNYYQITGITLEKVPGSLP